MQDNFLMHYGTKYHSGRWPYGSGENPYQHDGGFRAAIKEARAEGMTDTEIAKGWGMTTSEFRARVTIDRGQEFAANAAQAMKLKAKGYSTTEVARLMGKPEATVRNYLNPQALERATMTENIAKVLKENADSKRYIDVGSGTEARLGIAGTKLKSAIEYLQGEGYKVHYIKVPQLGTGLSTSVKVLTPPDVDSKEVFDNRYNVKLVGDYKIEDGGRTIRGIKPPQPVDSSRVAVRYAEDGGTKMDGVMQIRRGVKDLDLGNSRYAQVRISVDGTHYLKGMAMYADDLPDGVDIMFNTNKHKGTPMLGEKDNSVLKPMKKDDDNPFGATINDQRGALNIVNEEGDWNDWSRKLSSQMLSKQPVELAKKQLDLTYKIKKEEFDEIMSLTNPAVKKTLLSSFADDCDSSAVHLKAAGMPRQSSHVILPFNSIKDNEIFAPNYNNGEKVVLIRFPHGGTFEIPELTVNNNNKEARKILGDQPIDAVGINYKVAERLSGADFDGDTVLVIPNNEGKIKVSDALEGLKDFDTKERYPAYEGMKRVGPKTDGFYKQTEMGKVSNLITDMTIKGATQEEIARAVRHSMVVIDAEKHNLNWKQSAIDNGIAELKAIYQGGPDRGASTLISRSSSEARPFARKEITVSSNTAKAMNLKEEGYSNSEIAKIMDKPESKVEEYLSKVTSDEFKRWNEGKKIFRETEETYFKRKEITDPSKMTEDELTKFNEGKKVFREYGNPIRRTTESTKMAESDDAFKLSSGTAIETVYANHANSLKRLAEEARKAYRETGNQTYLPSARKTYQTEVTSLGEKLKEAIMNRPMERQAQIIANSLLDAKRKDNPDMDKEEIKKLKGQLLAESRLRLGSKKKQIEITPKEWEAIQAGAITNNVLVQILNNTDLDLVKQYATPREHAGMSSSKIARAKSMAALGYTQAEIADMLGVSTTTLYEYAFK